MMNVTIHPKTSRAKNRVREHGATMELVRRGHFQGEPGVLVRSLGTTWRGEKWLGWLTHDEATWSEA